MYARIYNKENRFVVWSNFNNNKKWDSVPSLKMAKEKCNELNIEFYSENKSLLPKGITIDIPQNRFRLHVRLDNKTVKSIKSSKDLESIIKIREHLIKNLLDLL